MSGFTGSSVRLARAADALTLTRMALAVVAATLLGMGLLASAAVVVSVAWLTDALDGRLARATSSPTGLGGWDLHADTLMGAGVLVGLWVGAFTPPWLAAGALLLLGGGYLVLRNAALGMALQGLAYCSFLFALWSRGSPSMWLAAVTILGIAVLDRRKLFVVLLPTFLRGMVRAIRLRPDPKVRLEEGAGGPPHPDLPPKSSPN